MVQSTSRAVCLWGGDAEHDIRQLVVLSIINCLKAHGHATQVFKLGPDVQQDAALTLATQLPPLNLDACLMTSDELCQTFWKYSCNADIALVDTCTDTEDASVLRKAGFGADNLLTLLGLPVIFLVDGSDCNTPQIDGCKAALFVYGLQSRGQLYEYIDALRQSQPNVMVAGGLLQVPESFNAVAAPSQHSALAESLAVNVDVANILRFAEVSPPPSALSRFSSMLPCASIRIAVANDAAFNGGYYQNMLLLAEAGAEIVPFSPLDDACLPDDISVVWLGHCHLQQYGKQLSSNVAMRACLHAFAEAGGHMFAEGLGLAYLAEHAVYATQGAVALVGFLPFTVKVDAAPCNTYVEVEALESTLLPPVALQGYQPSSFNIVPSASNAEVRQVFRVKSSDASRSDGFWVNNVLATSVHLHFGGAPECARHFVKTCSAYSQEAWRAAKLVAQSPKSYLIKVLEQQPVAASIKSTPSEDAAAHISAFADCQTGHGAWQCPALAENMHAVDDTRSGSQCNALVSCSHTQPWRAAGSTTFHDAPRLSQLHSALLEHAYTFGPQHLTSRSFWHEHGSDATSLRHYYSQRHPLSCDIASVSPPSPSSSSDLLADSSCETLPVSVDEVAQKMLVQHAKVQQHLPPHHHSYKLHAYSEHGGLLSAPSRSMDWVRPPPLAQKVLRAASVDSPVLTSALSVQGPCAQVLAHDMDPDVKVQGWDAASSSIVCASQAATEVLLSLGLGKRLQSSSGTPIHRCSSDPAAARRSMSSGEMLCTSGQLRSTSCPQDRDFLDAWSTDTPRLLIADSVDVQQPFKVESKLASYAKVVLYAPRTLADVFASMLNVGKLCGVASKALETVNGLQSRLRAIAASVAHATRRPKVLVFAGIQPLALGGHWLPDIITLAGGVDAKQVAGDATRSLTWEEARTLDPDVIVFASDAATIGTNHDPVVACMRHLMEHSSWWSASAVRRGQVFVVRAELFTAPTARVVDAVAVLARVLHPLHAVADVPSACCKVLNLKRGQRCRPHQLENYLIEYC